MLEYGFLPVSRKMFDGSDELWSDDEPFDRRSAWIDLLQLAQVRGRTRMIGGETVSLGPGELVVSERFLAKRWGWTKARVRKFLLDLGPDGLDRLNRIPNRLPDRRMVVIKITNYTTYNPGSIVDTTDIQTDFATGSEPISNQIQEGEEIYTNKQTTNARAHEGDSPDEEPTPADDSEQSAAIAEMQQDANRHASSISDRMERRSFGAQVRGIVSGDNSVAWTDHTGRRVPWRDRPRLLRLAFDALSSEQAKSLHWALVHVVRQQYDPIQPDTAEEIKARRPAPSRPAAPPTPPDVQDIQARDEVARKEAEERRAREDALIAEWERSHELDARRIRHEAESEVAANPYAKAGGDRMLEFAYRNRVLTLIAQGDANAA